MSIPIKRPQATVDLWADADLHAQWQGAVDALKRVARERAADQRETGEHPDVTAAREAVRDLEKRALDSVLVFTLQAIPNPRFLRLRAEHPPREGDKNDEFTGVNLSTFIDAVMVEPGAVVSVTNKATGEPVKFDAPAEWLDLADQMSNGQWEAFVNPLLVLNRGTVAPGFLPAAWQKTRS